MQVRGEESDFKKEHTQNDESKKERKKERKKLAAGALLSDEAADGKASQLQWNYL